jgi:hypothetical protein
VSTVHRLTTWWDRFWFTPAPAMRFEVFRRLVFAFIWIDVWTKPATRNHGSVDTELYEPLLIGRILPLPVPTDAVVTATMVVLLGAATVGVTGRCPRIAGAVASAAYLQWMVIAFSYGKVDHDRWPLIVALLVTTTVGRVRAGDRSESVAAGWALRAVQLSVVAVYVLSVVAKVRYGGWLWANQATLVQALVRRGTGVGRDLLDTPELIVAMQWAAVVFEATSIGMLVRGRARWLWWVSAMLFHAATFSLLTIAFWPQLLCLTAFLPLERIVQRRDRYLPDVRDAAMEPAWAAER